MNTRRKRKHSEGEQSGRPRKRRLNVSKEETLVPQGYRDCSLDKFTCDQLRSVCRSYKWKGFSKLPKQKLMSLVMEHLRKTKKALFDSDRMIVARPVVPINLVDAITQENLQKWNREYLFTLEGKVDESKPLSVVRKVYQFDPVEMVRMLLSTGEKVNPFNRQPMTSADITRLECKYISVLRILPSAPAAKRQLLQQRPDLDEKKILPPPSRADIGIGAEEDLPAIIENFVPWENPVPLEKQADKVRNAQRAAAERERTIDLLIGELRDAFDAIERYLTYESDMVLLSASCSNYIELAIALYTPMLRRCARGLGDMDVSLLWQESKTFLLSMRKISDSPANIASGTAAVCVMGLFLDSLEDIISDFAARNAANNSLQQTVRDINVEMRPWCRNHSTRAVIKHAVHSRLMQVMFELQ